MRLVRSTSPNSLLLASLDSARRQLAVHGEALLDRIWGDSDYRDPRTIDVHIRHLREKLEQDAKEPEYIFTVRGVGYRFRDRDDAR